MLCNHNVCGALGTEGDKKQHISFANFVILTNLICCKYWGKGMLGIYLITCHQEILIMRNNYDINRRIPSQIDLTSLSVILCSPSKSFTTKEFSSCGSLAIAFSSSRFISPTPIENMWIPAKVRDKLTRQKFFMSHVFLL